MDKKAPGEDGITGEVYKSALEVFPRYITVMNNGCLRRGVFPKRWKTAKLIPIVNPGKQNSDEVSKFRPISLLNTRGKVLEKLLINRINHHVFTHDIMNKNQYGFTPQRSTTGAAMAVKEFVEEGLAAGEIIVQIRLDVKGTFDAAWWSSILNGLKAYNCPKTFIIFLKGTLANDPQSFHLTMPVHREQSVKSLQGSCCGPGYWNILYNSLLNIQFTRSSKAVAFADDLI